MATINFLYRSKKDFANLNLRLLFRFNGNDFVIGATTKYKVSKYYWDELHNRTSFKRTSDIIELNKIQKIKEQQTEVKVELNKIEKFLLNSFNKVSINEVDKHWLKKQIDFYYNPIDKLDQIPTGLINYIDYYIDYRKNEIKETSKKKFNTIKNKLIRFETFRRKAILIKDINDSFKNEFFDYCILNHYSQNTIQREFVFIKTFCKHARFLGEETHPQLDSLRLDRAKAHKIYLTINELDSIQKIDKNRLTVSLENAKDWLIISCYTGQRISDFMRFTSQMIRFEGDNGYIEFTQKKTGKIMTIPLHPKVIEIVNKRQGSFPYPIADQKYNDYIKKVCEIAGITELVTGSKLIKIGKNGGVFRKVTGQYRKCEMVTSHIGRRSMASNFYGIIPTPLMINITGHSSERMYLTYVGKSSMDLAKETFKYF